MKRSVILLIGIFLTSSVALCLADESKGHICFRVLDSNKDGMVTPQEFDQFYKNDREKFKKADTNKDGKLTHDEYHSILGHGSS
jgi:hypothetical protein